MQTSLEIGFCCVFTIRYAPIDGSICSVINKGYAYLFAVLLPIFPIASIAFYKSKFDVLRRIEIVNDAGDELGLRRSTERGKISLASGLNWKFKLEKLCSEFYSSEEMKGTIKSIHDADLKNL